MLNTIALWDKIPAPLELDEKGSLKNKAAIRKDWNKTRSDYCYKEKAAAAFKNLMENLKARHILISYSTDGIIPFTEMKKICASRGDLSIVTNEYTKYRGGKQSNNRLNTNIEFILHVNTGKKNTKISLRKIDEIIKFNELQLLFKKRFNFEKLKLHFNVFEEEGVLELNTKQKCIKIYTEDFFKLFIPESIFNLNFNGLNILSNKLLLCICNNKEEEISELLAKINNDSNKNYYYIKLIPHTLKKIAHKKYKKQFIIYYEKIKAIKKTHPELYLVIEDKINQVWELANKRFNN